MTRNEEYQALLQELETTPAALDGAVERALRRRKRDRRLRLFGVPAGSLAACFAAFVLLVNLFPPFARACGSVPVLRELAQAVAWSPSLSAAVENDYVQPIGQSQTVNGVTATVEYVIVDRKQLNIFYTLDYAPDLGPMWADCRITPGDGSAGDAGGRTEKPGELVEIKRDFVDRDVPGILDLTLSVYPAEQDGGGPPAENTGDGYFDQPVDDQPAYLAEMTFHLEFDPYFTAQGTLLELNRTFALDGQTFTLQEAEIYPTHLRLTLTADPVEEIYAAKKILRAAGLRKEGVNLIACPTCGRTRIDLIPMAEEVERHLMNCTKNITVAVMGCAVNGPGEAAAADVGIAGGKGEGLIFRKGEILYKVPQERLVDALMEEIEKL